MAKNKCNGKNRTGGPCGATPMKEPDAEGLYWCTSHAPELPEGTPRFGKDPSQRALAAKRAGEANRKPRVIDILRERLEEEHVEPAIAALVDALDAMKAVITRDSEGNESVTMVVDHATRMRAAAELFDRGYGKPKQVTELTGADGGPLEIDAPVDALDRSTQAAALLARAGLVQGAEGNGKALNGSNGNGNGHA